MYIQNRLHTKTVLPNNNHNYQKQIKVSYKQSSEITIDTVLISASNQMHRSPLTSNLDIINFSLKNLFILLLHLWLKHGLLWVYSYLLHI